jgi:hypothetical protein
MTSEAQFRVQHVAAVPRGYKVRTVTRARHRVRIAFPPGRRVKGSGQVVEVLHPREENPCPVKNPAELVLMGANPKKPGYRAVQYSSDAQGINYNKIVAETQPFETKAQASSDARARGWATFGIQKVRVSNPAELVLMTANPAKDTRKWMPYFTFKNTERGDHWERFGYKHATQKEAWTEVGELLHSKYMKKWLVGNKLEDYGIQPTFGNPVAGRIHKNPSQTDQAADLYSEFHGREATGIDTYNLPDAPPATLAKLGALVELQTKRLNGWKWGELNLSGRDINLAASATGRQLYFIGGDQKLCRGDLTRLGADNSRELCDLGDCMYIAYRAKKEQVDGIESDYEHSFGEESGRQPRLIYDQRNRKMPRLYLVGGEYHLDEASRGIVN